METIDNTTCHTVHWNMCHMCFTCVSHVLGMGTQEHEKKKLKIYLGGQPKVYTLYFIQISTNLPQKKKKK